MSRAVKRRRVEPAGRLAGRCSRPLHEGLHFSGDHIGDGRENKTEQRKAPVVEKEHDAVRGERDACVEDLRREFAHALRAGVDIGHGFRHDGAHVGVS